MIHGTSALFRGMIHGIVLASDLVGNRRDQHPAVIDLNHSSEGLEMKSDLYLVYNSNRMNLSVMVTSQISSVVRSVK